MGMKAMKAATKAMKAMKVMKKKVSIIAKGKLAKSMVLRGLKTKTVGGCTASALTKNKFGKVVSKARSANQKKAFKGSKAESWAKALAQARKELNLKGFVPFGGKTAAGKSLYAKAKAIYTA